MGMTDDRQVQEAIARCVLIMVFYHNNERTPDSADRMAAEIRGVAREVAGMGDEADRVVFRPIGIELMARCGPELRPRVVSEFMSICQPGQAESARPIAAVASAMDTGLGPGKAKPDRTALARRLGIVRAERFGGDRGPNQLASMLGLPARTWRNYESGVSIPGEVLLGFIEITADEPLWLLHGVGPRYRHQRAQGPSRDNSPDHGVEDLIQPEAWAGQ